MESYIRREVFTEATPPGGLYDWDHLQFGTTAGVSVYSPSIGVDVMAMVDQVLDNGDLSTAAFRSRAFGYIYIIEE